MSLSLTDPQGRRFRIVHGWGTGPCKSKNLYRSHPEAEAFVERLSSEQLSDIVRCFFGGSDHRPRHLRETPVNQTATCRQPVPTKAHTAADRIAAAICNAHLVVQPDTRLQPVDDPRSKLRMEIRQTLSAILLDERQEAARHQALLDQESAINKGLIYTGAAMTGLRDAAWGLLCWAKEVSDLVNPAVRLQHRFTALTTAAAADSDKLQVFADTLRREEWREVVEVIGFDPSKITDEHMAQAMDAMDLVMSDASLRQSLKTFSWDYIKAQHAVELTNAGGAAVFEIALTAILAALTGGVGAVASIASKARHVTKFKKLGELLVDFAKASKKLAAHAKARAKQAAQTVAKNFDDLKTDMPAVDRKGERPKGVKSLPKPGPTFREFCDSVPEFAGGGKLAEEAFELFNKQDWSNLEKLFNENNLNGGWPPNGGAVYTENVTLPVNAKIDRYGGKIDPNTNDLIDTGSYFADLAEDFDKRALPDGVKKSPLTQYKVLKPIPDTKSGPAIPWFGKKGLGTQYKTKKSVDFLLKKGYLEKI